MPRMASPDMIDLAGASSDEESSRSSRSGSPALLSPRPTPPHNRKRAAHPSPASSMSSSPSLSPTSASGEDGEDDRTKMSRREQKREEKREALARAKKWSDERKRAAKIDRKISASDRRRGNGRGASGNGGNEMVDLSSPSSPAPSSNAARGAAAGAAAGASTPTPQKMTKEEREEARKRARRWHQGRRTNRGLFSESEDEGPEEVLSLSSSSEHVESPTRASAAGGARAFAAARAVTDDDVVNLASPPAASGGGSAWPPPPQTLHNIRWAPPPMSSNAAARASTARAAAGGRTSNGETPSSNNHDATTTRSAGVRISTQDMQQFRSNVAWSSAAASASRRSSSSGGESNDHSRPGRQWACPQCTLLNSPYQSRCGACYQRNPSLPSLPGAGGRNNNAAGGRVYDVDGDGTFVPEGRPGILRTNRPAFPSAARTSAIDAAARGYRTDPVRDMLVQSLAGGSSGGWGRPRGGPYTADLLRRMQQIDGMSYERLLELFGDGSDNRGASPSTIASLPVSRIADPEREIPEDRRECAICLEDFECGDERTSLPCLHGFHKGCVNRWLSSNGSCPVCKTSVRGGSGSG